VVGLYGDSGVCALKSLKWGHYLLDLIFAINSKNLSLLFDGNYENNYLYSSSFVFAGLFFLYHSFALPNIVRKNNISKYVYNALCVPILAFSYVYLSVATSYSLLRLQYFVGDLCLVDILSFLLGLIIPLFMISSQYAMIALGAVLLQMGFGLSFEWVVPISLFACVIGDLLQKFPVISENQEVSDKKNN